MMSIAAPNGVVHPDDARSMTHLRDVLDLLLFVQEVPDWTAFVRTSVAFPCVVFKTNQQGIAESRDGPDLFATLWPRPSTLLTLAIGAEVFDLTGSRQHKGSISPDGQLLDVGEVHARSSQLAVTIIAFALQLSSLGVTGAHMLMTCSDDSGALAIATGDYTSRIGADRLHGILGEVVEDRKLPTFIALVDVHHALVLFRCVCQGARMFGNLGVIAHVISWDVGNGDFHCVAGALQAFLGCRPALISRLL